MAPEILTAEQVAELLQISRDMVYQLAARGELPGRRIGRIWRFSRAGVDRFLELDTSIPTPAEVELAESEQRFRQLAESIDEVFWLTDWTRKELLYVSPSYERVFGRSLESLFTNRRSWLDLVHPDDRQRVDEVFARNAELGEYTVDEYRIVRDDGSTRWVRDRAYPIRDDSGNVYRLVGIAADITERKREEIERLAERDRLHHLLAASPAVTYSCGPGPDYPTTFISDNLSRMLGYEPSEFYGDPFFWTKRIHRGDVDRVLKELGRIEREERLSYEYRFRHKRGHYVRLHDELSAVRSGAGAVTKLVGGWFDITGRGQIE